MNIQPDIFDYLETTSLEPHDNYTSTFTYAEQKQIWNRIKSQEQENIRLHNIIKEVREYLEIFTSFDECTINGRMLQKAIDILDKENKND